MGNTDRTVYRIAQGALTNTMRHAETSRATVTVDIRPNAVALEVIDDGGGGPHTDGHGLMGMRERAAALGRRSARPRDGPAR